MTISQNGTFTPHKRRGPIAAEFSGPGPAAISLPTLFGNPHVKESTKARSPSYTFGGRPKTKLESNAPAPNAYNTSGLNSRGKDVPIAKTMAGKGKEQKFLNTPAPGTYNVEKSEDYLEGGISYTMRIKPELKIRSETPAPCTYETTKADTFLHTSVQHTFGLKPEMKIKSDTPAPGTYEPEKADTVLNQTKT